MEGVLRTQSHQFLGAVMPVLNARCDIKFPVVQAVGEGNNGNPRFGIASGVFCNAAYPEGLADTVFILNTQRGRIFPPGPVGDAGENPENVLMVMPRLEAVGRFHMICFCHCREYGKSRR